MLVMLAAVNVVPVTVFVRGEDLFGCTRDSHSISGFIKTLRPYICFVHVELPTLFSAKHKREGSHLVAAPGQSQHIGRHNFVQSLKR